MSEWREKYEKKVRRQLSRLRRLRFGDPFVVITDADTGKYVQCVGSRKAPMVVEVSTLQILTDKEVQAAQKLLGSPEVLKMGPRSAKSYSLFCSQPFEDVGDAAAAALDVMEKVFRAEGHELKVELPPVRATL